MTAITVPVGPKDGLEASWRKAVADAINTHTTDIATLNTNVWHQAAGAPAGTGSNGQWYYDTTNDRLYVSDGAGWIIMYEPEQSYTPTLTNVTIGTGGTVTGTYRRSGGTLDLKIVLTLGTSGVLTGQVQLSTPVALGVNMRNFIHCNYHDTGVSDIEGACDGTAAAQTTVVPLVYLATGTYLAFDNVNATKPFTWGSTDILNVQGSGIRMNTPYL